MKLGLLTPREWNDTKNIRVFKLMSVILRRFFRFNVEYENEARSILKSYKTDYLVGMHFRMSDNNGDFREWVHFIYEEDALKALKCEYVDYSLHPVFYVASDSSYIKRRIREVSNTTVILSDKKALHSGREVNNTRINMALQALILDMIILSKCKMLIVTKGSSFSYIAAAFQGSVPYYISRNTTCFLPQELTTLLPGMW